VCSLGIKVRLLGARERTTRVPHIHNTSPFVSAYTVVLFERPSQIHYVNVLFKLVHESQYQKVILSEFFITHSLPIYQLILANL
jgi:hypothetical protein